MISILFSNFSHYLLLLILFSLVILQYILIIGTISIISPNVLISIGLSIVYWIASIILVDIDKSKFGLIAPFEASNSMYMYIEDILNNKISVIPSHDILTILIFFILLFIINFVILLLSKKRWLKLGM
ncbi:ABC-type Na+ efflux pump permease subunit [Staphylococcus hominis]